MFFSFIYYVWGYRAVMTRSCIARRDRSVFAANATVKNETSDKDPTSLLLVDVLIS